MQSSNCGPRRTYQQPRLQHLPSSAAGTGNIYASARGKSRGVGDAENGNGWVCTSWAAAKVWRAHAVQQLAQLGEARRAGNS